MCLEIQWKKNLSFIIKVSNWNWSVLIKIFYGTLLKHYLSIVWGRSLQPQHLILFCCCLVHSYAFYNYLKCFVEWLHRYAVFKCVLFLYLWSLVNKHLVLSNQNELPYWASIWSTEILTQLTNFNPWSRSWPLCHQYNCNYNYNYTILLPSIFVCYTLSYTNTILHSVTKRTLLILITLICQFFLVIKYTPRKQRHKKKLKLFSITSTRIYKKSLLTCSWIFFYTHLIFNKCSIISNFEFCFFT